MVNVSCSNEPEEMFSPVVCMEVLQHGWSFVTGIETDEYYCAVFIELLLCFSSPYLFVFVCLIKMVFYSLLRNTDTDMARLFLLVYLHRTE